MQCPPWLCAPLDGHRGHRLPGLSLRRCHRALPGAPGGVRHPGQRGRAGSSSLGRSGEFGAASSSIPLAVPGVRFPGGFSQLGLAEGSLTSLLLAGCPGAIALGARDDAAQGLVFQLLLPGHCWVGKVELCRCVMSCRLGLPGIPIFWGFLAVQE